MGQKVANGVFFSFCVICPPFTFSYAAVSFMKHAVRERTIAKERDQSIKTYEGKVKDLNGKIKFCQDFLLNDKLSSKDKEQFQDQIKLFQESQKIFIDLIKTLKSEA